MNDLTPGLVALRDVMAGFPPLDSHHPQDPIDPADIYFPASHGAALDPDRSLVIGNRGMGKSFWASALVDTKTRDRIAEALPEARFGQGKVTVRFGFAEAEGTVGISRDELAKCIRAGAAAETIWRAVILPDIARVTGRTVPDRLAERLSWAENEPDDVRDVMRTADLHLASDRSRLVFVFDQLEQLADDLDLRSELTRGILRLALALKSYRALRAKIFMRPDHLAEDRLFAFPDASKIRGEAIDLNWRGVDLYGLLYSRLLRSAPAAFTAVCKRADIPVPANDALPIALKADEEYQHRVFDVIAGEEMGARKRGLPYTWLLSHLADARNQVSPRTFLRALKFAAEYQPTPANTCIDHFGIHEGVRRASENRLDDLKEDYPWVPPALDALKGSLVPCLPEEMHEKWSGSGVVAKLRQIVPQKKQPAWMISAVPDGKATYRSLMEAMADIGVIEIRLTTGKVDVPDIFRLPAGIKRKGGITQQQRRKVRGVASQGTAKPPPL